MPQLLERHLDRAGWCGPVSISPNAVVRFLVGWSRPDRTHAIPGVRWLALPLLTLLVAALAALPSGSASVPKTIPPSDWPTRGGRPDRNPANLVAKNIPDDFDPETGTTVLWKADLGSSNYYSCPVVAGGRVFVGTDGGDLLVIRHRPKSFVLDPDDEASQAADPKSANVARKAARKKIEEAVLIRKVEFPAAIRSTPTVAGGVLYVSTETTLYAIGSRADRR